MELNNSGRKNSIKNSIDEEANKIVKKTDISNSENISNKKQKSKKKSIKDDDLNSEVKSTKKHTKKHNDNDSEKDVNHKKSKKHKEDSISEPSKKPRKSKKNEEDLISELSKKPRKSKKNKEDSTSELSKKPRKSKKNEEDSTSEPSKKPRKSKKNKEDSISDTISSKKHKKHNKKSKSRKKSKKSNKHQHSGSENSDSIESDGKTWEPKDERIKQLVNEAMESLGGIQNLQADELKKELDRQNAERDKRVDIYLNHRKKSFNSDAITTEEIEDEINALQNEKNVLINGWMKKCLNDKENSSEKEKSNLVGKRKYLKFRLMEKENTIDCLAYKCEMLGNKYDNLKHALQLIERFVIDKQKMKKYRKTLVKLRDEIIEATLVIDKVQNMAHELLPANVSQHCKKVDDTKKRLIEMQDDLLEKRYFTKKKIIINEKEIETIHIAVEGEINISQLLENQRKDEVRRLLFIELRIGELNKIIERCNEDLVIVNLTLEEAQALHQSTIETAIKPLEVKDEHVKAKIKTEKIKELKENNKMMLKQIEMFKSSLNELEVEYNSMESSKNIEKEMLKLLKILEKETNERRKIAEKLQVEKVLRKTYYNQVEDMKGAIRVYCRIRPINSVEAKRGDEICFDFPDVYTVSVKSKYKKGSEKNKEFLFDQVFPLNSSQGDIFKDVDRLVEIVFTGFNVCIFAYGQTGSGKTYTLIGSMENESEMGIVPRSFKKIFELIEKNKKFVDVECNFYMLELYNDKLLDLLKTGAEYSEKLEIRKNEQGMVIVPGLTTYFAHSSQDMTKYFHSANKNRHIASTKMNSESSRSHLILTIIFKFTEKIVQKKFYGKLSIIDLAGSERSNKSGVTGINLTEATAINKALTSLGDVISALTQANKGFVPYRNHKLTQLMQDSLGGTAKTLMIVNLSPVDYNLQESISSLQYATRVKTITNEGSRATDSDEVAILKETLEKLIKGEPVTIA